MKKVLLASLILIMSTGVANATPTSCTVTATVTGSKTFCNDGSKFTTVNKGSQKVIRGTRVDGSKYKTVVNKSTGKQTTTKI